MIEVRQPARPVPWWLSAAVIVAVVGGAGWVVRAMFFDTRPRERIVVLERGADDGIQARGDNRWQVRAGNGSLNVDKDPAGKVTFTFVFWRYDFLGPDVQDTLTKVRRLVTDRAMAAQINLTPGQLKQLQDVRKGAKVELPADDHARLAALWSEYEAAADADAKRSAETQLIRAVDGVAKRLEGPVRQSSAERAARARQVLTPEQWHQFDQGGAE